MVKANIMTIPAVLKTTGIYDMRGYRVLSFFKINKSKIKQLKRRIR